MNTEHHARLHALALRAERHRETVQELPRGRLVDLVLLLAGAAMEALDDTERPSVHAPRTRSCLIAALAQVPTMVRWPCAEPRLDLAALKAEAVGLPC